MNKLLIVPLMTLMLALPMPSNVEANDVFICDSGFDGFGPEDVPDDSDVMVPPGAVCILDSTLGEGIVSVGGDVTISQDAFFLAAGVSIDGDVESDGAAAVVLFQDLPDPSPDAVLTVVDGDVEIRGTTGTHPIFGDFFFTVIICEAAVDGDIEVDGTSGSGVIFIGDPGFCFLGVFVDGDVRVTNNSNAQGVLISDNVIDGDLVCTGNNPPASGIPDSNVVEGDAVGECAGLADSGDDDDDDSDSDSDSDSD